MTENPKDKPGRKKSEEQKRKDTLQVPVKKDKAGEALQESPEHAWQYALEIDSIYNSAPIGLCVLDCNLRFLRINERLAEINGVPAADHIGKTIHEIVPDIAPLAEEIRERIFRTGDPVLNVEFTGTTGSQRGRQRYWNEHWLPLKNSQGNIIGINVVVEEVTERRKAEDSVNRYIAVIDGIARIFRSALPGETEEDCGRTCLAIAEEITQSSFGFIGEIGSDDLLHDIAISDPGWKLCTMYDKTGHRGPPGNFPVRGLYGRVITDGKGFFTNDPSSHPDSRGMPEGHPVLTSFLGVPFIHDGKVVGMVAVGNREGGYREEDLEALKALADAMLQALSRKRAEKRLRGQEKHVAEVLSSITESYVCLDGEWRFLEINPVAEQKVFRRPANELLGKVIWEEYPERKGKEFHRKYEEAFQTQRPVHFEALSNISGLWVEVHAYPRGDRLEIYSRDITERKQAEEDSKRLSLFLQKLIDAIPAPVFYKDSGGVYLGCNTAFEAYLGLKKDQIIGKTVYDVAPKELAEKYEQMDKALFESKGRQIYESSVKHSDGTRHDAIFFKEAFHNENSSLGGLVGVIFDVTERKRAEEELNSLTEELKRSNAELEQFAYAASHDLREPLRTVASFVRLFERRYKGRLDEKADEFIAFIIEGVSRMEILLKDLLEFSRLGVKARDIKHLNCSVALEKAIYDLGRAIEESGVKITYDLLPTVVANEAQITRLFQNLIANSIKFRSKKEPKIHVSAAQKDNEWVFSVRDNGIGIDPQFAERIFVVFQRLHTRQEYGGTGIGLALSKKIVELHGGRIWVESEPGKGATFFFTLPVRQIASKK